MAKRDHAGVFVPPPVIFVLPLVVAAIVGVREPWPIATGQDTPRLIAAFVLLATGISIGIASVLAFREANTTILPAGRPTTMIVVGGPYRYSRNPMYVAMAIGYIGLSLLLDNGWALSLLPFTLVAIDVYVIRREEKYLADKFGEPYRHYLTRVRRWL